jgi:hypothetical protein
VIAIVVACGGNRGAPTPAPAVTGSGSSAAMATGSAATGSSTGSGSGSDSFAGLGDALRATIPETARVVGFGELHMRTDRAQVRSTLARFSEAGLPAIADKVSDLVIETWFVDKNCGSAAVEATARVETTMRRPEATKDDITILAETARKAGIQPHAMRLSCDDYQHAAPPGKDVDPVVLLDIATRELGRVASEAVAHRDRQPQHRPWIAVYGGAVHPARFPDAGVAEWSYAAKVDDATGGRFVEIDLIVPELAEADPVSQKQPWFALVRDADARVHVWKRGERSFVLVLPRTP